MTFMIPIKSHRYLKQNKRVNTLKKSQIQASKIGNINHQVTSSKSKF